MAKCPLQARRAHQDRGDSLITEPGMVLQNFAAVVEQIYLPVARTDGHHCFVRGWRADRGWNNYADGPERLLVSPLSTVGPPKNLIRLAHFPEAACRPGSLRSELPRGR